MEAGKLNKRITIQKMVAKPSPSNQQKGDWVDVCSVWAQMATSAPKTVNDDGAIQHESTVKFYIRKRDGITAQMRVKWNGRVFHLIGPPVDWNDGRTGLTLVTKELV